MPKILEITDASTASSGWTSLHITTDTHGKGEVLLGKNITSHDLKVGMDITYDIQESQWGPKFKIQNFRDGKFSAPKAGGGGGGPAAFNPKKEKAINSSVALGKAVDLCCHGKIEVAQILPSADKFLQWLTSKGGEG